MSDDKAPVLRRVFADLQTDTDFGFIDEVTFWGWYDAITVWGFDRALQMAMAPVVLVARDRADEQRDYLRRWLEFIKNQGDRTDREEYALLISYKMLALGNWSRRQAARFASSILNREIQPDAWRKRLDKWIREKGWPPLQLPRSRNRNPESSNDTSE